MVSTQEYDMQFSIWVMKIEKMLEDIKTFTPINGTCIIPGTDFWSCKFEGYISTINAPNEALYVQQLEQQICNAVINPYITLVNGELTYDKLTIKEKLDYFKYQLEKINNITPDANLVSNKKMIQRINDAIKSKMPYPLILLSIECAISGIGLLV